MPLLSRGKFLIAVSILLLALPILAEESDTATDAGVPVAETIISVPDIPKETEALRRTLRRFVGLEEPDVEVFEISQELEQIRALNETEARNALTTLEGSVTLGVLKDLESFWIPRARLLDSWTDTLRKLAESLEEDAASLSEELSLWERTLDNARTAEAPPSALEVVERNLTEIASSLAAVRDRRKTTYDLLTTINEAELEADDLLGKIVAARALLRTRIFQSSNLTIWQAFEDVDFENAIGRVRQDLSANWNDFLSLATKQRQSFVPILVLFTLTIGLAFYSRQQFRERTESGELEGSASVFERPISVAFVITYFFSSAAMPSAPQLVRDFAGVVVLLPIIRVLVPIVPAVSGQLIGFVSIFYLTDRLRGALVSAIVLERMIFLGEMLTVAAVIWSLLRPARLTALPREESPSRFIGSALNLAMVAFVLSAAANFFGYLALAKLLGEGMLQSIYTGVLAYAGYRIMTMLVVIALSSPRLQPIGVLRANSEALLHLSRRILKLLAGGFWALQTLDGFALRDPIVEGVRSFVLTPFEFGTLSIALGDLLAFPITIALAFYLSVAIRSVLSEDVYTRVSLGRGVGNAVSTTVHYALLLGGFLLALGASGVDLARFSLLAGALGVGIGFGLQEVVNNFISGLILLFERPIQVGDTIELTGVLGDVKRIGIRSSTITTFQGAEVVIPNGTLLSEQLTNWTLSNRHRRVEIAVGVAYGNSPSRVIEVLKAVLVEESRILREPEPMVLFRGFGDSSLDFELRFWARDYVRYLVLSSEIASAVYDALEREGITIPFPQRDLHIKSVEPQAARQLQRESGED